VDWSEMIDGLEAGNSGNQANSEELSLEVVEALE